MTRLLSTVLAAASLALVACAAEPASEAEGMERSASSSSASNDPFAACNDVDECKAHMSVGLLLASEAQVRDGTSPPIAFRQWYHLQTENYFLSFGSTSIEPSGDGGFKVNLWVLRLSAGDDDEAAFGLSFHLKDGKVVEDVVELAAAG